MLTEKAFGCVRLAATADEEELVAMVRQMHDDKEWGLRDAHGSPFAFCEHKTRATVQRATQRGRNEPDAGKAWIGVIGQPGALEGSVYLARQPLLLSDGEVLAVSWHWVQPQFRGGETSNMLVGFAMGLAEMLELTLTAASLARSRSPQGRLYERVIGKPAGAIFAYNSLRAVA